MPLKRFIGKQLFRCGKLLGELHFIVQVMNAIVTKPAHIDATIQHRLVEVFPEKRASVKFLGNQMMKGERSEPPAAQTISTLHARRRHHETCFD